MRNSNSLGYRSLERRYAQRRYGHLVFTPLKLPTWTPLQRFLAGVPRLGASVKETIATQLASRTDDYVALWEAVDDVDLHLAFQVAALVKRTHTYPNDYLIPDDPCALLFIDDHDALTPNHLVTDIEQELNVTVGDEAWRALQSSTFADFIRALRQIKR